MAQRRLLRRSPIGGCQPSPVASQGVVDSPATLAGCPVDARFRIHRSLARRYTAARCRSRRLIVPLAYSQYTIPSTRVAPARAPMLPPLWLQSRMMNFRLSASRAIRMTDLDLNDAFLSQCDADDRVLELHCDQECHDRAEQCLEHPVVQDVQSAADQQRQQTKDQLDQRDHDDDCDDETQREGNDLLETLVRRHPPRSRVSRLPGLPNCDPFPFLLLLRSEL